MFGILCFGAGLVTGRFWNRPDTPENAASSLATKAPATPGKHVVPDERAAAAKRDREQKKAQQARTDLEKQQADMDARQKAYNRIKPLIDDALQLDDEAKRTAAIESFRKALASSDPDEVLAGLSGLSAVHDLAFDRALFRDALKPHLQSDNEAIRRAAWYGMIQCGLQDEDIKLLREVAKTKGCGESTSHLLFVAEKGDLTGESGAIVRDLIRSERPETKRGAMNGIWGAKLSPELEEEVIALSRQKEYEHDAIYYSLSTQANKSLNTVNRLIEALAHPDSYNTGGRAAWGLQQGVSKELAPRVADAAVKVVGSRASGYMWDQCWTLLTRYAGPDNLDQLRELAAKPGIQGEKKAKLDAMIEGFENASQ
ncbi:hypothetical protein [Luteolibacter luteus]|uniref:HEAT repeat domain-containing protein n=1 Tax=Luteolibacter luteus TaxID=2728835 RepID=A0A858RIY7_9BACT|nr:hypothetical protein [Luteolibacter luteus]QJE96180.1 hypothetical protein HHL09_10415 [Luteolibacter luteus]